MMASSFLSCGWVPVAFASVTPDEERMTVNSRTPCTPPEGPSGMVRIS